MSHRHTAPLAALAVLGALLLSAVPAFGAEAKPAWGIDSIATPTNFKPGDASGDYFYEVTLTNVGAKASDGSPVTITDTLPEGVAVKGVELKLAYEAAQGPPVVGNQDFGTVLGPNSLCEIDEGGPQAEVSCELPREFPSPPFVETADTPSVLEPGEALVVAIEVEPLGVLEDEVLTNQAVVEGGGAPPAAVSVENEASAEAAGRGFAYFRTLLGDEAGEDLSQAAAHPWAFTTSFALNTKPGPPASPFVPAGGDAKDIGVALPPGLIGNPNAAERCTAQQFTATHGHIFSDGKGVNLAGFVNECPDDSAVGYVFVQKVEGNRVGPIPLYNLDPPPGVPAQLGFQLATIPFYVDAEVRSGSDYGIDAVLRNNSEVKRVTAASVTIWGTPADPRHDPLRGSCMVPASAPAQWSFEECESGIATPKPFFRAPTSCASPLATTMFYSTWTQPAGFLGETSTGPAMSGCNQVPFDPTFEARPTTDVSDSPAGLHVDVHVPQKENEDPEGRAQADLKDTTVVLPKGLVINPASANGLDACSPAQIDLNGKGAANCPDAARIGTVQVDTPLLDHPLPGSVYVATPHDNPFDSLLAIYITVNDPVSGVVVKLAGNVKADPSTGQLTATVDGAPQLPFEDFRLDFFGGAGAALRTPATCGTYSTTSVMTPWSAPESGAPDTPSDTYAIAKAPGGGNCPTSEGALPFSPTLDAGTIAPIARQYTPFVLDLRREDGSSELSAISVSSPPGLLGKLAGIPYCPDSALTTAAAKSGNAEKQSPSCPSASELGSVTVAAGAGPAPYWAQGKAYLAPPYKGAPLSIAVITPAAAGPYDLGTVVSRVALKIDPETAQIDATSDPIPHILQGIPLDVREIKVALDRPSFTFNPSSCDPMSVQGNASSVFGQSAALENRFQVGECAALPFKPKLSLKLKGGTKRGDNPKLIATLKAKEGEAGIARTSVTLPRSAFLDQSHIRTICTRVQWAADACPKGSIYGKATATTPLLDYPISGNVYLRSSNNKLPDLVIDLRGPASQPVRIDLVGRTDSVKGALRNTFDFVPDAPVSTFRLELLGGKRGLVVNSRDICAHDYKATVELDGQNGKVFDSQPVVGNGCKGKKRKRHGGR